MEAQAVETGDEMKMNINAMVKPLHKIIADNKDVAKVMMQLNAAVVIHRNDVTELLNDFSVYDELWKTVTSCQCSAWRHSTCYSDFIYYKRLYACMQ